MSRKIAMNILKLLKENQQRSHRIGLFSPFSLQFGQEKHSDNLKKKASNATKLISETALNEARNLVDGLPIVRRSLNTIMSDEFKHVASHFTKIVKSGHPIVKTTQNALKSKSSEQTRKLIVLLISDLMSPPSSNVFSTRTKAEKEAYTKNLSLAELTELLYIAFLLQRGLVNMIQANIPPNLLQDFELGNKMSVLGGDFLLAKATTMLSQLENSTVLGLMAAAVQDMSHGFFTTAEQRECLDEYLIKNLPSNVEEWRVHNSLAHSSLMSNACRSGAVLHNKDSEYGDICAEFGHHLTLTQQARSDINQVSAAQNGVVNDTQFLSELSSLPSAVASESDDQWIKKFLVKQHSAGLRKQIYSFKRDKFVTTILNDQSIMEKSEQVCHYHADAALAALYQLPDNRARDRLQKLTLSYT